MWSVWWVAYKYHLKSFINLVENINEIKVELINVINLLVMLLLMFKFISLYPKVESILLYDTVF